MNNEDRFELYYHKYGEIWTEAKEFNNPCYKCRLARATWECTEKCADVAEMAYAYDVDEQQLWDNVRCQQAHNMWCDSLEVR